MKVIQGPIFIKHVYGRGRYVRIPHAQYKMGRNVGQQLKTLRPAVAGPSPGRGNPNMK